MKRATAHHGGTEVTEKGFHKKSLRALRASVVSFCICCCSACAAQKLEMARVGLHCSDAAADVMVDGAPAGKAADYAKTKLVLRPGHHVFTVRGSDGSVQVREADLGPGDWIALDLGGTP